MSSILGFGGLALQQPAPSGGPTDTQPPPPGQDGSQTVQPSGNTKTGNGTDTSGSGSNTGTGSRGSGSGPDTQQQAQSTQSAQTSLSRATPSSVVEAQSRASNVPAPSDKAEDAARQSALNLMEKQKGAALYDRLGQPIEKAELAPPKKAPDLPDPLPTSPFLKGRRDAA